MTEELFPINKVILSFKTTFQSWMREVVKQELDSFQQEIVIPEPLPDSIKMTVAQVADKCQVKETTVRDWCKLDKIRYQRTGRRILIESVHLDEFLESKGQ